MEIIIVLLVGWSAFYFISKARGDEESARYAADRLGCNKQGMGILIIVAVVLMITVGLFFSALLSSR